MKNNITKILFALVIIGGLAYFFYTKSQDSESVVSSAASKALLAEYEAEKLISKYPIVPIDELYADNEEAKIMLDTLKERYKKAFVTLSNEVKASGAKLAFCWITSEPYIPMQVVGRAFIEQLCKENGVDFIDLNPAIIGQDPKEITFLPVDGHLNKKGSLLVAKTLASYVKNYAQVKSTSNYQETDMPETFGDFEANKNEILDGGKGLPYKLVTNKQGLRMNYDLEFPKTKQRILLMGDSGFFSPFVDNENTISGQLQSMFPDKEICNAANWGYSIDDYLSQWQDKIKYLQPDLVLLQSSGEDIAAEYFTQRLRFSRKKDQVKPTEQELKFYTTLKAN
jgi:hypothetical protein